MTTYRSYLGGRLTAAMSMSVDYWAVSMDVILAKSCLSAKETIPKRL